jgi:hypothetical protein
MSPAEAWFIGGQPRIPEENILSSYVRDQESHFLSLPCCGNSQGEVVGDLSRLVGGVVDVVDIFRLIKFSLPKPHPFHEVRMYEIVGGS